MASPLVAFSATANESKLIRLLVPSISACLFALQLPVRSLSCYPTISLDASISVRGESYRYHY